MLRNTKSSSSSSKKRAASRAGLASCCMVVPAWVFADARGRPPAAVAITPPPPRAAAAWRKRRRRIKPLPALGCWISFVLVSIWTDYGSPHQVNRRLADQRGGGQIRCIDRPSPVQYVRATQREREA